MRKRNTVSQSIGSVALTVVVSVSALVAASSVAATEVVSVTRQLCKTPPAYRDFHQYKSPLGTSGRWEGAGIVIQCHDERVLGWCFRDPIPGSRPFVVRKSSPIFDLMNETMVLCHMRTTDVPVANLEQIVGAGKRAETELSINPFGSGINKHGYVDFVYNHNAAGEIAGLVGQGWDPQGRIGNLFDTKANAEKALSGGWTSVQMAKLELSDVALDVVNNKFVARGCVKNAGAETIGVNASMAAGAKAASLEQFEGHSRQLEPGAVACFKRDVPEDYVANHCTALEMRASPTDTKKYPSSGKIRLVERCRLAPRIALTPIPSAPAQPAAPALPAAVMSINAAWTIKQPMMPATAHIKQGSVFIRASLNVTNGKAIDPTTLSAQNNTTIEVATRQHTPFAAKPAFGAPSSTNISATALVNGTQWSVAGAMCADYRIRIASKSGPSNNAQVILQIAPSPWIEFTAGPACK